MRKLKHKRVQFATKGKSLTHQSERTRADINNLVRQGIEPPDPNQMTFRDFSDGSDFQSVQDAIVEVKKNFDSLPSDVRDRFQNNPRYLIDFVNNPDNAEEATELGLLAPPEPRQESKPKSRKKAPKEPPMDDDSSPPIQPDKEADLTT